MTKIWMLSLDLLLMNPLGSAQFIHGEITSTLQLMKEDLFLPKKRRQNPGLVSRKCVHETSTHV